MTDLLHRIGVSNLCISVALALVAWAVRAGSKRPLIAHLLWLLVFVKLITPPLLTVPVFAVPRLERAGDSGTSDVAETSVSRRDSRGASASRRIR